MVRYSLSLALVVSSSLAGLALTVGEKAPDFQLARLSDGSPVNLGGLLSAKPVAIWFCKLEPDCHKWLQVLQEAASTHEVQLVAIPVAPNAAELAKAQKQFPQVLFLADPDGAVTLRYAGEFVAGVAPRENLYVLDLQGKLKAIRCYPGIPHRALQTLFSQIR